MSFHEIIFEAPLSNLLVVFGIGLLCLALVGEAKALDRSTHRVKEKASGKIEMEYEQEVRKEIRLSEKERVGAGLFGLGLIITGILIWVARHFVIG